MEVLATVLRIHTCRGLVRQLIQKVNDILRVEDEMMRSIVTETIKSMEIPLKFYWSAGVISIILWSSPPFMLVFQKNSFFYIDYTAPVVYTKEPITTGIFVLGSVIVTMSSVYIFTKKVGVDSYIINLMLLITAQYKYIALKLSMIFQDKLLHSKSNTKKYHLNRDCYAEKEIKALCRHHNTVIHISSLNIWLNLISGNLLPMSGNSSFSIFWKMYSAFMWSLLWFCASMIVCGCFLVPLEQALVEGVLTLVVMAEAVIVVMRIHGQRTLVRNLIEKVNDILNIEDKSINNIVVTNVNPLRAPFKLYLVLGTFSTTFWCSLTLTLVFEKSVFHYTDLKTPVIFFKQPFSAGFFLLSTTLSVVANVYVFLKKISVDIYTTHLISLITSQYQYIASKLASVFRDGSQQDDSFPENNSSVDTSVEKEIKNLCWQHNNVVSIMKMLKKLLSVNIFLIYVNSVFRFCFLGVMLMTF
ncbi:PREDICTED: uncharacterized protein LOC105450606 [Wasmannia auropunctata]|uniref:uncharacterized protein LOC105450606 n=1 Tax=Wasmannia auropunctata TaxID=64793 RepID=UPI0005ED77B8|nr:PREDICTED: uncharacterized protein LOC105450606 [Wasmannia auropunctata]